MNKKAANFYVKMTAKNATPFLGIVLIGVAFLLYLTMTTNLNAFKTYDVLVDQNEIIINHKISDLPEDIYIYTNRNEIVYTIKITDNVTHRSDSTVVIFDSEQIRLNQDTAKVDIAVSKTTLFNRIFLRGGKISAN